MNKDWEGIIDHYIRHELTAEEKTAFAELLRDEPGFREQLKFTEALVSGLERVNEEEVWAKMIRTLDKKKPLAKRRILQFTLSVAAIILILLYSGMGAKYPPNRLFEMSYHPAVFKETYGRGGNNVLSIQQKMDIQKAFTLYKEDKYYEVWALLDPLISTVDRVHIPEEVLFYHAMSQIETGDSDRAFATLYYLSTHGDFFLKDAKWYLALLYVRKGEKGKAVELLKQLQEGEYKEKANELLNRMNTRRWF